MRPPIDNAIVGDDARRLSTGAGTTSRLYPPPLRSPAAEPHLGLNPRSQPASPQHDGESNMSVHCSSCDRRVAYLAGKAGGEGMGVNG
jgi:hypothetical protein